MRVLVFGKTGQVARELQRFNNVSALSRADADLNDPAACAAIIAKTDADVIINAAAYTGVDAAETDTKATYRVNSDAPTAMAEAAAKRALPFLHVSTDYVFDGSGTRPWLEDDATGPLGVYGASKRAGEQGVRAAGGSHASLLDAGNFVRTLQSRQGLQTGCLEEIAFEQGWIGRDELRALAEPLQKNGYGAYLMGLLE